MGRVRVWWLMGALLGLCLGAMAEGGPLDKIRPWVDAKGNPVEGRILEYDAVRKAIRFESASGKKVWIKPSDFSKKDQKYIQEWIAAEAFLSQSKFKVAIDKKTKSGRSTVTVSIENKGAAAFENVSIEYKCLMEIENYGRAPDIKEWRVGAVGGIGRLKSGESRRLELGRATGLITYKNVQVYDGFGNYTTERHKVSTLYTRGVLIRISGPVLDGVAVIRELSLPKNFGSKYDWDAVVGSELIVDERLEKMIREVEREKGAAEMEATDVMGALDSMEVKQLKALEGQARDGDAESMVKVARSHETGKGTSVDYDQAIAWYTTAARSNSLDGCAGLARIYASCPEPEYHDGASAVKFAAVVARKRPMDADALLLLSAAHFRNMDQQQAIIAAVKAASRAKSPEAAKQIRTRIENYKGGIPHPPTASEAWLEAAVENGNPWAARELVARWSDPDQPSYNLSAASRVCEKTIEWGHGKVWVDLGDLYLNAPGEDFNPEKAFECYKKSQPYYDGEEPPTRVKDRKYLTMPLERLLSAISRMRAQDVAQQNQERVVFLYELAIKKGFVAPGVIERYKSDPGLFGMKSVQDLRTRAYGFMHAGDYARFIRYLSKSHDIGDETVAARLGYFYMHDTVKVAKGFHSKEKAIEWNTMASAKDEASYYLELIRHYSAAAKYQKAAHYADLAGNARSRDLVWAQAEAYGRASQYDKAIERVEKYRVLELQRDPKSTSHKVDGKLAEYRSKMNE